MYYENSHSLPSLSYIKIPTGITLFPADILLTPKEWAVCNLNVTRWTSIARGGHFTAIEEPELLAQDIRAFYKPFRAKNKY
ncbi:alpha/beta hydrolase [Paenibacillus polymyxa]|uniref:alpha/beta fold hydrolase n=1 Tax=Paenibacillus polymyxa TaxID=1406 RepID=UPI0025B7331E|nr:alpha/beta hydrolase [Paenibacillus polymyxa]MDN4080335.1 alpha/beta hydrolase [Paenibacillus polymyxa]MDN4105613.1 alpha/beta hydrolase [Paenibacillus polymyxa]MDN4115831.1 alpha/beta hydrolase [Paenibacillus polymyxa]